MKRKLGFSVLMLTFLVLGLSFTVFAQDSVVYSTTIKDFKIEFDQTGAVIVTDQDGEWLFDLVLMYQGSDNAPHMNYDSFLRKTTQDGKKFTKLSDNQFRVEGMRNTYIDPSRQGKEMLKTNDISYICTLTVFEDGFDLAIEMQTKTPIRFNTFGPVIAFNHEAYIGSYLDIDGNEVYFHDDVRGGTYASHSIQVIKVLKHDYTISLDEPLPGNIDDNRQWSLPGFYTKLRFVEGTDSEPGKVYSRTISVRF